MLDKEDEEAPDPLIRGYRRFPLLLLALVPSSVLSPCRCRLDHRRRHTTWRRQGDNFSSTKTWGKEQAVNR